MWRPDLSGVAHSVRDGEVAGSNPVIPTYYTMCTVPYLLAVVNNFQVNLFCIKSKIIDKKHFVYIIKSDLDNSWYYGYTENIAQRLNFHNEGISRYTKTKRPWALIFLRSYNLKREALKFEKYLKKTRNKDYIGEKYAEYFL